MENKIAVVIPVRGKAEYIERCLASIQQICYSFFEVIVVDDGLNEDTLKKLVPFRNYIKIIKSDKRGPSYARNLAAQNTEAEFLAFTDSDCLVDGQWLNELLKGFEAFPNAAACGGRQELPTDAGAFEKRVFLFMKKANLISDYARTAGFKEFLEVEHLPSFNVMYRRDVFLKEGGFLEGLWPGEDVELDYRLRKRGYRLVFNSKASVYHYKPKTLEAFLRMMERYGFAQGFLVRKYGIMRKMQLLPLLNIFFIALFLCVLFFSKVVAFWFVTIMVLLGWLYWSNLSILVLFVLGNIFWNGGFIKGFIKRGI
jgi:glycosyltransferase involved in cell wall biosynthesis